jgi:serine/threonine-protein kinase RsbW
VSDVSLTVPGRAEYLRLVRLAAADAGARADLSIEDIEDLRIAVDELTYALIGDKPGGAEVTLRYTAMPGVVEIEGSCAAMNDTGFAVGELSRTIIGGVTSEYAISEADGERRFRLVKRARA